MLRVCVEVLSAAPLRATLAWTDPPTAEGADRELVNALGLMLIGGGRRWRQAGEVNTFEQISVEAPAPGRYHLLVTHESVRRPPQRVCPRRQRRRAGGRRGRRAGALPAGRRRVGRRRRLVVAHRRADVHRSRRRADGR